MLRLVPHSSLQKYSLAPNIMAMVSSFNQLALLIPSEILEEQTPHARAKIISSFIKARKKTTSFHVALLATFQCCKQKNRDVFQLAMLEWSGEWGIQHSQ